MSCQASKLGVVGPQRVHGWMERERMGRTVVLQASRRFGASVRGTLHQTRGQSRNDRLSMRRQLGDRTPTTVGVAGPVPAPDAPVGTTSELPVGTTSELSCGK